MSPVRQLERLIRLGLLQTGDPDLLYSRTGVHKIALAKRMYIDWANEQSMKVSVGRRMAILSRPNIHSSAIEMANNRCMELVTYYLSPGEDIKQESAPATDTADLRSSYEALVGHSIDSPEFAKMVDEAVLKLYDGQ